MENVESQLKTILTNPLIYGVLAIILTMYGPRLSPKPPAFVSSLFNSAIFRFLVLVLVIFVGSEDLRLAMSVSIVFLIVMSVVNTENIREDFTQQVKNYIANYNLYESSSLPNNSEHFTEGMIPQNFNFKCTIDVDKSDSNTTSRDSSPEPTRRKTREPTEEPTEEPTDKKNREVTNSKDLTTAAVKALSGKKGTIKPTTPVLHPKNKKKNITKVDEESVSSEEFDDE